LFSKWTAKLNIPPRWPAVHLLIRFLGEDMPIHHNMLGHIPSDTERILFPIANQELGAESSSAYLNVLNPGAEVPLHEHPVEEIIVCLSGTAECSFNGGTSQRYETGSVVIIPANTPHSLTNIGAGHLRQLTFFSANDPKTQWHEPKGSVT
jgi:quercetin dioxygenase-like cupin family protein